MQAFFTRVTWSSEEASQVWAGKRLPYVSLLCTCVRRDWVTVWQPVVGADHGDSIIPCHLFPVVNVQRVRGHSALSVSVWSKFRMELYNVEYSSWNSRNKLERRSKLTSHTDHSHHYWDYSAIFFVNSATCHFKRICKKKEKHLSFSCYKDSTQQSWEDGRRKYNSMHLGAKKPHFYEFQTGSFNVLKCFFRRSVCFMMWGHIDWKILNDSFANRIASIFRTEVSHLLGFSSSTQLETVHSSEENIMLFLCSIN
jgi:hypothetical protein